MVLLHAIGKEQIGLDMGQAAIQDGFVVVTPIGLDTSWNAGTCCDESARDGVDDATWLHHLKRHDYSAWIDRQIKDPELAAEVHAIEATVSDPRLSRAAVRAAVERLYTLPAGSASA